MPSASGYGAWRPASATSFCGRLCRGLPRWSWRWDGKLSRHCKRNWRPTEAREIMCHTLKKGTTSKLLLVYALDAADRHSGKTGLKPDMPGAGAVYAREGEVAARRIPLSGGRLGAYQPG